MSTNENRSTAAALSGEVEDLRRRLADKELQLTERQTELTALTLQLESQRKELDALRQVWGPLRPFVRRRVPNPFPRRPWVLRVLDRVKRKVPQSSARRVAQSPLFDAEWYLNQSPELQSDRLAKISPALHYVKRGAALGLDPGPDFNTQWYLANNPDVKATGVNPLVHYIVHGMEEGRSPTP